MILTKRKTKQSEGECEMIKKYTYGTPFPTESVTEQFAASEGMPEFGVIHLQEGFSFTYKLRMSYMDSVKQTVASTNAATSISATIQIIPIIMKMYIRCMLRIILLSCQGSRRLDFTLIIRQHLPLMAVTQDRTSFISSVKGRILICMLSRAEIHTILQSSFER